MTTNLIPGKSPIGSTFRSLDGRLYVSTGQGLRVLDAHVASALLHRESLLVKVARRAMAFGVACLAVLLGLIFWVLVIE